MGKVCKVDPEFYYTRVNYNTYGNSVELVFKSSLHDLRTAVTLKDLSSLINIKKQIEDIIQEIQNDNKG